MPGQDGGPRRGSVRWLIVRSLLRVDNLDRQNLVNEVMADSELERQSAVTALSREVCPPPLPALPPSRAARLIAFADVVVWGNIGGVRAQIV